MGRRKRQIAVMNNSLLMKDKHKRQSQQRRVGEDSFLHTTELNDGTGYNRINFQSVTEQSNLEDFLNTAEMAGKDFTAERQNIQIITNPSQGIKLSGEDMEKISEAQQTHKALLQIPRRPKWDESTTKEELNLMERDAFTDWRRQLKILEEKDHIQLTPYEKNLDFWRQLWRVIERSDVIVQIVDARNPLLFRCEDLDMYVEEVDPKKVAMLLINKADYLTMQQRQAWVRYFNKEGIRAVFFSAKVEKERQEGTSQDQMSTEETEEVDSEDTCDEEELEEDEPSDAIRNDLQIDLASDLQTPSGAEHASFDAQARILSDDLTTQSFNSDSVYKSDKLDISTEGRLTELAESALCVREDSGDAVSPEAEISSSFDKNSNDKSSGLPSNENISAKGETLNNDSRIVTADELLDIFRKLAQPSSSDGVKTIGMVGYPNVGKSSTINVILNEKKLAVSATPGRTKHLQTLYVDQNLMLCDCPGLVFPSFVATKAHLVINGILPIDEMRDHVSPTNLVCELIPRSILEATYSIMIPRPSLDDDPNRIPTAEEVLNAYGAMRGFMTPRGVPDGPRAARYILKDFVKGKLLYCEPPPGIFGPEFQDRERIHKLELQRPVAKVPPPQIKSDIDREFFAQRQSKAHSRGKTGVSDVVRVDTLKHVSRNSEEGATQASFMGSQSSINSVTAKSWKKHNNRNKKEKLRRLHRDLDSGI